MKIRTHAKFWRGIPRDSAILIALTPVWHLSFSPKLQGYFTAVYAVFENPASQKGLNVGRHDRALAHAVPPLRCPG